jgi:hypothetical protein
MRPAPNIMRRIFLLLFFAYLNFNTFPFRLFQLWGYIQKFPDWVDNEMYSYNKHALGSNTKGYGGRTH